MKKINVITVFCAFFLMFSCNSESQKNDEKSMENIKEEAKADCDCRDLYFSKKIANYKNNRFTGKCETKDAQGNLVMSKEYNDGYTTMEKEWQDVNRKMVQVKDMKFYNNEYDEGYILSIWKNEHFEPTIYYVKEYKGYKAGKVVDSYKMYSGGILGKWYSDLTLWVKEGKEVEVGARDICKMNGNTVYSCEDKEKVLSFLNCIESKKLPKFFYTK